MIEEAIRDLASAMRDLAGAIKAHKEMSPFEAALKDPKNWKTSTEIVYYSEEAKRQAIADLEAAPVKQKTAQPPVSNPQPPVSNPQPPVSKAEPVEAPEPEPTPEAVEPEPTPEAVEAAAAAIDEARADISYDADIKPLVMRVLKEKGRETALAVLGTLGVTKAQELQPEQFAQAKAALESAL